MNHAEALKVIKDVQRRWFRHPIPANALDAYRIALEPLPYGDAMAAVEMIAASGDAPFPPSAGDLAHKVAENAVAPIEWDEVKRQLLLRADELRTLDDVRWTCTTGRCDGSTWVVNARREAEACSCREDYIASRRRTDLLDPLVRTWIDQGYVTWDEVDKLAAGDTTVEAQSRDRWRAYVNRLVNARVVAGMKEGAGVPVVERAREHVARSLEQVRRAALPAAPGLDVLGAIGEQPERVTTRPEDVIG